MTLVRRLLTHYALIGFGQGLLLCVLTLFMIEKGLSLWQVGVAFGAFGLTAVILELPLGATADLRGRIRVYRWSLLVSVVALVIAITVSHFVWILLAMCLMGFSRALESGSVSAWEIEQIRHHGMADKTATLIGQFQATNALGIALGALCGGYIPQLMAGTLPWLTPATNNLVIVLALTLIHILLLPWLFKEGDVIVASEERPTLKSQITVAVQHGLKHRAIRPLLLAGFLFGMVLSNLEAYWQPFVKTLAPDQKYDIFGWIATGYFFSAAAGPAVFSMLIERIKVAPETMITIIFAAVAPVLYALGSSQTLWSFALLYFLFMGVMACVNIPVTVLLNDHTEDRIRSTMQSVMSLVLQGGGACAAFALAPVIQHWGIGTIWHGLAVALLSLAIFRLVQGILPKLGRGLVGSLFKRTVKRT
jgi:MFS family permease